MTQKKNCASIFFMAIIDKITFRIRLLKFRKDFRKQNAHNEVDIIHFCDPSKITI